MVAGVGGLDAGQRRDRDGEQGQVVTYRLPLFLKRLGGGCFVALFIVFAVTYGTAFFWELGLFCSGIVCSVFGFLLSTLYPPPLRYFLEDEEGVPRDVLPWPPPPPVVRWAYRPARRDGACPSCERAVWAGNRVGERRDRFGPVFSFCERCARVREEAERLGLSGVKDEYAAGRVSQEQMEEMTGWLTKLEDESP